MPLHDHFCVNHQPLIRVPDANEASLRDIDILWGFDQVKWWQMGPNEGCHLVCSPMGWEARGGREDDDDDYEHGTNDTAMLLQHQGTRSWLPDGYCQIFRLYLFGPLGLKAYGSATLQNFIPSSPWIVSGGWRAGWVGA